ncbi:unnamed protein product, partial [Schistocephalus solidus]
MTLRSHNSGLNLNEPVAPIPGKSPVWSQDPSTIFTNLTDGAKVFVHGACSSPVTLISMLYQYGMEKGLKNITVNHMLPLGPLPYLNEEAKGTFRLNTAYSSNLCRDAINSGQADFTPISVSEIPLLYRKKHVNMDYALITFFSFECSLGNLCRDAINSGQADFTPISVSEIPLLYRKKHVNMDYALITVTPPDKHGFCSLGAGVGTARSAIQNAQKIIGQVNPMSPVSYGDGTIHCSKIDFFVHGPEKLQEILPPQATQTEQKIAKIIAENLVEDGATIQLGFGRIPYEVTNQLRGHRD